MNEKVEEVKKLDNYISEANKLFHASFVKKFSHIAGTDYNDIYSINIPYHTIENRELLNDIAEPLQKYLRKRIEEKKEELKSKFNK